MKFLFNIIRVLKIIWETTKQNQINKGGPMIYKCFICNSLKHQIYNYPHHKAIQDIFKDKGTTIELGKKKLH